MQQIIFMIILFFIIGCGAQNSPNKENGADTSVNRAPVPESMPTAIYTSNNLLPNKIFIDFPKTLDSSSNDTLLKEIESIKTLNSIASLNLNLLINSNSKIFNECNATESCHFEAKEFSTKYRDRNVTLGTIEFDQYSKNSHFKYQLTVTKPFREDNRSTFSDTINYRWGDAKDDILTTYKNKETTLSSRYLLDFNNSERMIIKNDSTDEKSLFVIKNDFSLYHLSSNHIKNLKENFSSDIWIEENVLIKENEEIIPIDSLSGIEQDGHYLLLPPLSKRENLTLNKMISLSVGLFSYFDKEFQGFLYGDKFMDRVDELIIIQLTEDEKGFKRL